VINATAPASLDDVWRWLDDVPDPEIPTISVVELGIVREVSFSERAGQRACIVTVTPTYSGCPATEVIAASIREALMEHGLQEVELRTQLSPAWTTAWLSESAREKLSGQGIAPPGEQVIDASRILRRNRPPSLPCPRCGSLKTESISAFGSTPCKALWRCGDCLEPFEYFKPH
jgi:ring-1,2-phenylacetyl-CoA epoxidase subunit PaaD